MNSSPSETTTPTIPSDPAILSELVKKQVEYYFSRENLQNDSFLTSQMDSSYSVPISTVMQFAKLKALTQDEQLVRDALVSSKLVCLVDDRIKSTVKLGGRNTIILRDIPPETPEEKVREIFFFETCKPIVSMRSDLENTWFVVMESEQDAKDTLLDLKLKKRTFNGEAVKARLKSETITRSFYMLPPPMPAPFASMGYPGYLPPGGMFPGYINQSGGIPMPMMPNMGFGIPPALIVGAESQAQGYAGQGEESDSAATDKSGSTSATGNAGPTSPPGKDKNDKKVNESPDKSGPGGHGSRSGGASASSLSKERDRKTGASSQGQSSRSREHGKDGRRAGRGKDDRDSAKDEPSNKTNAAPTANRTITVNAVNFPPLGSPDSTPIPTPGYKGEYKKYSHDAIINVVKDIRNATLPASIHPELHLAAMETSPNRDLLKRQRTFSIDETREQLRQGRPVHREAVLEGSVDYASMMLGDGYQDREAGEAAVAVASTAIPAAVVVDKKPATGSWAGILMNGMSASATDAAPSPSKGPPLSPKKVPSKDSRVSSHGGVGGRPKDRDGSAHNSDRKNGQHNDSSRSRDNRKDSTVSSNSHKRAAPLPREKEGKPQHKADSQEVASPIDDSRHSDGSTTPTAVSADSVEKNTSRSRDHDRDESKEKPRGDAKRFGRADPAGANTVKRDKKLDSGDTGERKDAIRVGPTGGEKGKDKPAGPTSWMGKPTFANVLKQKHGDHSSKDLDGHVSEGVQSGMEVLEIRDASTSS